jgi:predicted lipoprotein with Yx(FWY)xxD motif
MKPVVSVLVALLAAFLLTACGGGAAPATTEVDAAAPAPPEKKEKPAPKPGTEVVLGDSQFGDMLFDENDQAIYLFTKETGDKPDCYDDCAAAWPPVLTKGEPVAGKGVKQSLLGTTERKDGTTQVTYGGHPLYFYANEDPGQVLCHNVEGFGGTWLVVGADGDALPA